MTGAAAPWQVADFSRHEFRRLLATSPHTNRAYVEDKDHTLYFEGYLATLQAQTIVAEYDYVDRDYLEDFAAYYVRCHENYSRLCTRLHFFRKAFTADAFAALLSGDGTLDPADLAATYLGFVVVKPLPETIFGRTCLSPYPHDGRRYFPITRTYHANLFGVPLKVESLAFQEQDQAAAACATSALWSAFQGTGILFQHHIPSPVEITRGASEHEPERTLPSGGLTNLQMAHAIRRVTLEPTLLGSLRSPAHWKASAYAYVRGGVPVVVTGTLIDHADPAKPKGIGEHAIVIAGYSLAPPAAPVQGVSLDLTGARVEKFYAHDDQIGAFARMPCSESTPFSLYTSWRGATGKETVQLRPGVVLLPLYHKVRVPFSYVRAELLQLEAFLNNLRAMGLTTLLPGVEWDVFLDFVNNLKVEIAQSALPGAVRRTLLEARMPRFIWRARAIVAGSAQVEFLFDATGLETGNCCFRSIEWTAGFAKILRGVVHVDRALVEGHACWRLVQRLL